MSLFKLIVQDLIGESSTYVDVWKISLKVAVIRKNLFQNDGEIIQIKKSKENDILKMPKIDEKENIKITSLKTSFINYFSIGIDARIGFGKI